MSFDNAGKQALLEHFFWMNMGNPEKACAVYNEEVEYDYRGPKAGALKGSEAVTKAITAFMGMLPNNRVYINRILTMGNEATVELMSKEVDPGTGETVMMREIMFVDLRDGKISKFTIYRMDPALFTGEFAKMFEMI